MAEAKQLIGQQIVVLATVLMVLIKLLREFNAKNDLKASDNSPFQ
ncbi:hypothetical protein [Nostoc sp. 'Peltigera membranacea cyanobiont' 232]|jgi:hypothetical protein|nr:hypothetical protein [Nostoc sp. 'Peltigera membranacea cyanobiont' 232]